MSNTAYAALFMDAELNHSSAYFASDDMSLEVAQRAKNRLILDRCQVRPSMRLLDIGCGWGGAARLASVEYQAKVIGITLDPEQAAYGLHREEGKPIESRVDFRVQRWEEFAEPDGGWILRLAGYCRYYRRGVLLFLGGSLLVTLVTAAILRTFPRA